MIRISPVLLATIAALSFVACDPRGSRGADGGDDPIEALGSTSLAPKFNETFWGEQRRSNPELWTRATEVCDGRDATQFPNCRPVLSLLLLERTLERTPNTSAGFDGSMDLDGRADSARERLDSLRSPE